MSDCFHCDHSWLTVTQKILSNPGHECQSARYVGFGGLKNGELLDGAEATRPRDETKHPI
jgi:hypothetical protein